jgi:hypothetical protein
VGCLPAAADGRPTVPGTVTNDLNQLTKIGNSRVILENKSGSVRISLRKEDLGFYYERIEGGDA